MQQFLKKSIWSFVAVISRGLGSLVINKIFALYFGTPGISLLAHFQNLIAIFTLIPNDGINRGLIRSWSDPQESLNYRQDMLSTAIMLTSLIFTLFMIMVFIRNDIFIMPFIEIIPTGIFVTIVIFSVLAILANLMVQSLIIALSKIKAYAILVLLGTVVLLIFLFMGVSYQIMEIAFIAYAIGSSVSLVFSLIYLQKGLHFKLFLSEPTKKAFQEISQFIAMALSVLICGKFVDFFVRSASMDWFGMDLTGYWQSLVKLSDSYVMVFSGTVGVVFYPAVASMIHQKSKLSKYLRDTLGIIIPSLIIFFIILYMLGKPILNLLFSSEFVPAYQWMHYQIIGDFFMLVAYLFAYILMAGKNTLAYILLQVLSVMIYLAIIFIFRSSLGIESILIGHMIRNIIFLIVLIILIRKL
jgi:O-antigen/teichoic acid export membrane protein